MKYKLFSFFLVLCSCKSTTLVEECKCVNNFQLKDYLGTWYEIARLPNSFEKNLVGVTATYTLNVNNTVTVLNNGYYKTLDGKLKSAKGLAKYVRDDSKGSLKVSFFRPFYADYLILDTDYLTYSLVGSNSKEYLWILSRTDKLDDKVYKNLLDKALSLGYDISKLELIKQN